MLEFDIQNVLFVTNFRPIICGQQIRIKICFVYLLACLVIDLSPYFLAYLQYYIVARLQGCKITRLQCCFGANLPIEILMLKCCNIVMLQFCKV